MRHFFLPRLDKLILKQMRSTWVSFFLLQHYWVEPTPEECVYEPVTDLIDKIRPLASSLQCLK